MIDKVIAHIEANRDRFIERLNELLRIPCVSTDPAHKDDMRRGAEWIHRVLTDCGFESEIVETPGHAAVLADTGPVEGGGRPC